MRRRYVLAALLAVAGAAPAADKFGDLTMYLPAQVNSAVVADLQAIYASPLAQKGRWASDRPLPLPPTMAAVALAARIDPDDFTGGRWEVGAARMKTRLTMDQIAEREKGAVDTVAGAAAVLSARNAYFVELRAGILGMMYPADRQELGRWLREVRNTPLGSVHLPPFLKAAVTGADRQTQFVLALDLTDAVNPDDLRKQIGGVPAAVGKVANLDALVKLLAGVHGAKLTLTVTDAVHGEVRFEFAESPAALVPVARPLLAEFLSRRGAALEGLDAWTASAAGNALVLTGPLPEKGFRRILSLIAPPAPPADHHDNPLAGQIKALATQRYFKSIEAYLDDLQKPSKSTQQDYTKFATWYDSFAQKVEHLPTYNVDPDVAQYGRATAARLHGIAASLRGDVVDVQKLEQSITITPYVYAVGGWGRRLQPAVWLQTNEGEVRGRQQEAIAKGAQVRHDLWSRIENDTGAMRQTLAGRYK
jgi:hypothetical protein